MAKWVADNPTFPGRAWAQWIRMMYRDGDSGLRDARGCAGSGSTSAGSSRTCWS